MTKRPDIECPLCEGTGINTFAGDACPDCNGEGWRPMTDDEMSNAAEDAYTRQFEADAFPMPERGFTCFHCGETFTTPGSARNHFGFDPTADVACRIKIGAERGLVMALRKAEQEAADAWAALHNESGDIIQAYYRQTGRHRDQIMAAEESGYEKGLEDGKREGVRLGLTAAALVVSGWPEADNIRSLDPEEIIRRKS